MTNNKNMTTEQVNRVYDILVGMGGAAENMRDSFIHSHIKDLCEEWRFGGKLGFGGKYISYNNKVTCYKEDETDNILELINNINVALSTIFIIES